MAERAVEIDRALIKVCGETLAGDELEDIAGFDEFFAVEHHLFVFGLSGIRNGGFVDDFRESVQGGNVKWAIENFNDRRDASGGSCVGLCG